MTDNSAEMDAMRFRWLREQARIEHRDGATNGTWRITGIPAYDQYEKAPFDHKSFDAAVDAAAALAKPASEPAGGDVGALRAENERYKTLAKQLSGALLIVRPLGGSELFRRFSDDEFYADPDVCGQMIVDMKKELREAKVATIRARAALGPRPCDCERCDCGNMGDAQEVARWDERAEVLAALSSSAAPAVVEGKLVKRPVAYRICAPEVTNFRTLYYATEDAAREASEQIGVDYEALYVRDGTPLNFAKPASDADGRIAELEAENARLIQLLPPRLRPLPEGWTPYAGRTKEEWEVIAAESFASAAHLPED